MATAGKSAIQIEWFNVTYRSVLTVVLLAVLAAVGGGGYWYYFYMHQPKAAADDAIRRADRRMAEAGTLSEDPQFQETLENAAVALREARSEFSSFNYDNARFAAIRSENLSLAALRLAGGQESDTSMVRFYRIEGDVRVKKSGAFSWEQANEKMELGMGDQVKTASSASAQLIYFDGTKTTIQPGSLLEIRDLYEDPVTQVRRVREKLSWGELEASTQERNVAGSYHEVATDKVAARAEEAGDFRVAYDKEDKTAKFDVFEGKIQIDSGNKRESLVAGESIEASAKGALSDKLVLPGVPSLRSPRDQRVFISENPEDEKITLRWDPVAGAEKYHLIIADRALFTDPLYDAERGKTTAVLDGVSTGAYFWKVAAVAGSGKQGPFSKPRRFRVSSQKIRDKGDNDPPALEITEFVPIGQMVIVNGRTEPGASLWVDNENIDVTDDGTFYTVVRLTKEGVNELRFVAQDTAGNETLLVKPAFVEMY